MSTQEVVICNQLENDLQKAVMKSEPDKVFVLTDEHTHLFCFPVIEKYPFLKEAVEICIGVEDIHKNLETLAYVWTQLSTKGATRHSLLINLGGGMVTDLGGFAAATFKRGIAMINIPTTLLGMVDASVGGKTGINFNGLKNEVGVFAPADSVLIDCEFLKSLDHENLLSGYAEMLKHGLISNTQHWSGLVGFDMNHIDYIRLQQLVAESIAVKEQIVGQDPFEKGIRKALNFGHTVGHAFESFAMEKGHPILHGYAIAAGMVCELYYSHLRMGFPKDKLRQTIRFIKENYGRVAFTCEDYERLYAFMCHDKKNNVEGQVNFTLISEVGDIHINQVASQDDVYDMLDFYSETMG